MTLEKLKNHIVQLFKDMDKSTPLEKQPIVEQEDPLWNDLKHELMELVMENIGEFGLSLFEWEEVLRTAMSFLQAKERQYKRMPKRAIEKALESILPATQNGRSLVQFVLQQLSRLKRSRVDANIDIHDRAMRILAYVLVDLAERYLIPMPNFEYTAVDKVPVVEDDLLAFAFDVCKNGKQKQIGPSLVRVELKDGFLMPLTIQSPFYENPTEQLKALEDKEKTLIQRLERIKKIKSEFDRSKNKSKISHILTLCVLEQVKPKFVAKVEIPDEKEYVSPKDLKRVYREILSQEISKLDMQAKMIYPNWFFDILKLTSENCELLFLEEPMKIEMSFDEFERLVQPDGILYNLDIVQKLLGYITEPNRVEILYDWMIKGYKQRPNELIELFDKIIDHTRLENGFFQLEEFCKLFPSYGSQFIMEFLASLKDTITFDKMNPQDVIPLSGDSKREEAYEYIKEMLVKQGISVPEVSKQDTSHEKRNYLRYIQGFHLELPKQRSPGYPMQNRSEDSFTTEQRRNFLFSESRKEVGERITVPTRPYASTRHQFDD